MSSFFKAGRDAFLAGLPESDNPYIIGKTKLGSVKMTEEGHDWLAGWLSEKPARVASKEEIAAVAKVDVTRFRRKPNRYYS